MRWIPELAPKTTDRHMLHAHHRFTTRSPRRRLCWWAALAAAALAVPSARTASAAEPIRPAVVLLLSTEGDLAADALLLAVQAQLSDLPLRVDAERSDGLPITLPDQVALAAGVAERHGAATVFWFDLSLPEQLFVYLAQPGGGRLLVRTIEATEAAERVESAAVIVRGLMQAILNGGAIGIALPSAAEPPASTESPVASAASPPPAEAPARSWFGLQLGYSVDFFSTELIAVQGLGASLLLHVHDNWSLFAAYRIQFPSAISSGEIDLTVNRHPVELGVRFRWPLEEWDVGASVSAVVDFVTRNADSQSPELAVTASDAAWLAGFGVQIHGSRRIAGSFRVLLDAGFDVFPDTLEYAIDAGGVPTRLLRFWFVCPRLLIGLAVDLV